MKEAGEQLRTELKRFLDIQIHRHKVDYRILDRHSESTYERLLISYPGSENDTVKAYLFLPRDMEILGSVLVHHQHNAERHLGKSEVAGIIGDPYQFFCQALAGRGIISLAPDSICFEDRRTNKQGIEPDADPDHDVLQHYNEMCYRLLAGKSLMKKVIEDSSIGISLLTQLTPIHGKPLGILGHSYGGNTVIFHSPFDDRIGYSCTSGAVCSYRTKFENGTGIEMAEVIPGFSANYDIEDLLMLISPRKLLIMAATLDKFSQDAEAVYLAVKPVFEKAQKRMSITFRNFPGQHQLDQERFDVIINWFVREFKNGKA